ncbi:MAG: hypothetical protein HWE25_03965 [Alphaproteobacteria bacterium]|nr:hypothetical protein [Alphaproteobacteria bacterium]
MTDDHQLLSTKNLLRGTVAAAVFAGIALVTVILPAEYEIDPLGTGKVLGLTDIAAAVDTADVTFAVAVENSQAFPEREDTIEIPIAAGKGLEYKLHMLPGATVQHEWTVDGGELYYDFHGEPQGDTTGYYESFAIATSSGMSGLFYAPWEGSHGWYWKNKTDVAMTITLKLKGSYEIKGLRQ